MGLLKKRPTSTWGFWSANWDSHYPMVLVYTNHRIAGRGSSIYLTMMTDGSLQCSNAITTTYRAAPNIRGLKFQTVKAIYRNLIQEVLNEFVSKYDNINTIADYFYLNTNARPNMETQEGRTAMILNAFVKYAIDNC